LASTKRHGVSNTQRGVLNTQKRAHLTPASAPRLMLEKCIREKGAFPSRGALMRALPRKVDRQTLVTILDYLEASEKILMDGGSITWLFTNNPKLIQLLTLSSTEVGRFMLPH